MLYIFIYLSCCFYAINCLSHRNYFYLSLYASLLYSSSSLLTLPLYKLPLFSAVCFAVICKIIFSRTYFLFALYYKHTASIHINFYTLFRMLLSFAHKHTQMNMDQELAVRYNVYIKMLKVYFIIKASLTYLKILCIKKE